MIGSLRIMHFGFLISVIVAVLIIGKSLDASALTQIVECPCEYGLDVPKTPACWKEPYGRNPDYGASILDPPAKNCFVVNVIGAPDAALLAIFIIDPVDGPGRCGIDGGGLFQSFGCTATLAEEVRSHTRGGEGLSVRAFGIRHRT